MGVLVIINLEYLETLGWRLLIEDHCLPCQSIGGISSIAATTPDKVNGALVKLFDIWEIRCKHCTGDPPSVITVALPDRCDGGCRPPS